LVNGDDSLLFEIGIAVDVLDFVFDSEVHVGDVGYSMAGFFIYASLFY
jgi:hypothetical protein